VAYATLALGSALDAFMYPHTLTGIFASQSKNTIRKNAVLLPAYTLLLGRAPALLTGWIVGFAGGTALVWINGLKPLHALALGPTTVTVYIGLLALAANLAVAVIVNLVWHPAPKVAAARM
jgi:hypothetical protein